MMHYFTFNGRSTQEFGIWISGEATFSAPERNVVIQEVDGRDGALIFDKGNFKNVPLEYPAFIKEDMPHRVRDFLNYAGAQIGYKRLEDTYHPYEYRMARFITNPAITSRGYMNRSGEFTLEFDCKPQRFLKSGEQKIVLTSNNTILNRTNFDAKPLLRVYGSGAGTVSIASETITISQIDEYVDIDCEIMDAFKGATNCNSNVAFSADDIVLHSGNNGVSFTGAITQIDLIPRWWII